MFIVSDTKDHLTDLKLALELHPSEIFIEKGFANISDQLLAERLAEVNRTPIYLMNQRRYSSVFECANITKTDIKKIDYNWEIETTRFSEWALHANSIDNYLKGVRNYFFLNSACDCYQIDNVSSFTIKQGKQRNLTTTVYTDNYTYTINLDYLPGCNRLQILEDDNVTVDQQFEEDCLGKLINCIHKKDYKKLEQL